MLHYVITQMFYREWKYIDLFGARYARMCGYKMNRVKITGLQFVCVRGLIEKAELSLKKS